MAIPLDPTALARVLLQHDLPPPVEITPLGRTSAVASYRLRFGQEARIRSRVLRVALAQTGRDPLATERAALQIASPLFDRDPSATP